MNACPVCGGEGRVYRMTPAYEVMVAQSSGTFSWTGPSHEWRRCIPCGGKGLIPPPLLPDDDTAVERLMVAVRDTPIPHGGAYLESCEEYAAAIIERLREGAKRAG